MIDGDKTCEPSSEIISINPYEEVHEPLQFQNSDDGEESPVHSHYSSFGDSERYCSANSVMGTPSLCSSVGPFQENGELDFGRGSVLGESSSLENFKLEGEFSSSFREMKLSSSGGSVSSSVKKNEDCEGKNSFDAKNVLVGRGVMGFNGGFNLYHELENGNSNAASSSFRSGSDLDEELCILDDGGGIFRRDYRGDLAQNSVGEVASQQTNDMNITVTNFTGIESDIENVDTGLAELDTHSDADLERDEREGCLDEEGDSSRYEHSEGEDSMFGCGTDDDQKLEFFHQKNMQLYQEAKGVKGNNFLMSSSVAFGSEDWDDFAHETSQLDITSISMNKSQSNVESKKEVLGSPSHTSITPVGGAEQGEIEMDISVSSNQDQAADESLDCSKNTCLTPVHFVDIAEKEHNRDVKYVQVADNDDGVIDELAYCLENQIGSDISFLEQSSLSEKSPFKGSSDIVGGNIRERPNLIDTDNFTDIDGYKVLISKELDNSALQVDPPFDVTGSQFHALPANRVDDSRADFLGEARSLVKTDKSYTKRSLQDLPASLELFQRHPKPVKTDNVELDDFCNELVQEMEEILLDSSVSSRARFTHNDIQTQTHSHPPLRDGGSTASTSGTNDTYRLNQHIQRIDAVEVIGAKQRKGDVSFSERLVGVKEYTVYVMRVQSRNDHWEVERRYRDFCTLYRRLKSLFTAQGWELPSPWAQVERESRKIFGNVSPDVVRERSSLIQECLRSILSHQFPSSLPDALIWFLSPQKNIPSSPSSTHDPESPFSSSGTNTDSRLIFGKTISLVVEIRPYKSTKQILEAQHFTCAGCRKHFDDGKTLMLEFVQTLGWGKPRLCEYTGQLFCSTCHTNELAVLPSRVLHYWDFTPYPVSQLAKSYLDSIHDKPMLCVSAVNPFLFSKVPALQQVTGVRKRIGVMLPYVRCPFRMSIFKGLGPRRYLLESNDFFALRDLIDLSKGAFAALPVMVDTVSRKILEHITEQCLVCCDVGVPCNARQSCNDPSALIFPFQEGEIERCRACKSVFHKHCFGKIPTCPCGESLKPDVEKSGLIRRASTSLDLFGRKSDSKSTVGFLSGLFTKGNYEKFSAPRDDSNVISMGSLPSTSL